MMRRKGLWGVLQEGWLWSLDLRVKYWRPSINPARLPHPFPYPFLYVTYSFPLRGTLTSTPLYGFSTPGFTPNTTSSNFTCLINTPAGLIWPCPAVMGRGIDRRSFQQQIWTEKLHTWTFRLASFVTVSTASHLQAPDRVGGSCNLLQRIKYWQFHIVH